MTQANDGMSTIAILPHQFAVAALVGPIDATKEEAGDLLLILGERGFLAQFPSFHIRVLPRVRKTAHGYEDALDQPLDHYIVGAVPTSRLTRARRELGVALKRATGRSAYFSKIPRPMLQLVKT